MGSLCACASPVAKAQLVALRTTVGAVALPVGVVALPVVGVTLLAVRCREAVKNWRTKRQMRKDPGLYILTDSSSSLTLLYTPREELLYTPRVQEEAYGGSETDWNRLEAEAEARIFRPRARANTA